MRVLLDGNSILNTKLLGGKDDEYGFDVIDGEGKKHYVNGHQYGVDRFFEVIVDLCLEFDVAPRDMVLVWDGPNAKALRQAILPGYKAGRDKLPEVSQQLNIAREMVDTAMRNLGATSVQQHGREADDVIGYLCKTMRDERNIVVTGDGDLTVLHDENTDVFYRGELNVNPYGKFPHKYITLYKALVGDSSDKIPGAKGFGDGAWLDLVRVFQFEGLEELQRMIVDGELADLKSSVDDLKSLQKIIDSADMVTTSWNAAKLYTDKVNTMRHPLEIKAGMVQQWGVEGFQVHALKHYYGTKLLVTADNFDAVYARLKQTAFKGSPFVSLDIETSSTEESDEWLQFLAKATESKERLDVLGHELTGMGLTFGKNTQHTIYMSVDHKDTNNITVDQCRMMCELIPQSLNIIVQNRSFEFSVLYRTWGEKWKDNGWSGFLPNCLDTKIGASYVDENLKKGLKERSKVHLGYEQTNYEQTTSRSGPVGSLKGGVVTKLFKHEDVPAVYGEPILVDYPATEELREASTFNYTVDPPSEIPGRLLEPARDAYTEVVPGALITPAVVSEWETRQYKMNELRAMDVFDYGCDDTICTAALHTYYKFMMQLEGTWQVYLDVETLPEYLTSLAFVQGIKISKPRLLEMEKRDQETFEKAWATLRGFLMTKGWEGTICPEFEGTLEPADVKMAVDLLLDGDFTTKRRKLNALAADIRTQFPDNDRAFTLAAIVEAGDIPSLNSLLKENFTGEPKINFGSPKQIQNLFYRVIGIKPRIVNKLTDKQREIPEMVMAFKKFRLQKAGKPVDFEQAEWDALISKASTDDTAVDSALAMDELTDDIKEVLKAYKSIKEVQTRQNLFYKTYKAIPHWRDGRIHPSLNQSEAVTRRYSSSGPNVQQLPSKGEGARFREILLAHKNDAVVVSLDFSGQELRLGAELSGDAAMTSCYVGDNLRDMHSLTAVAAAVMMWGQEVSYDEFQMMRKSEDVAVAKKAKKLRDDAKTVNFASQYGAMAAKIAETMMCDEETAQAFLDARAVAFPGIIEWDARVQEEAKQCGFSRTMLGARRHLREALLNENSYERSKAERQVGNFWIQGSAAEMTKLAMARVWKSGICTGKYDAVFYCPIHDELVFSVHKDQVYDFLVEAHACMVANYAGMKIPLESSIAIGPDFSCDFEIGTVPNLEEVKKVLDEIFQKSEEQETV